MPLDFIRFKVGEKMKIKIMQATVANGEHQEVGAVIDVEASDGVYLCGIGRAERVHEPAHVTPVPDVPVVEPEPTSAKARKAKPVASGK